MSEHNPWELIKFKREADSSNIHGASVYKRLLGNSDTRLKLVLCTLCHSVVVLNNIFDHLRYEHKHIFNWTRSDKRISDRLKFDYNFIEPETAPSPNYCLSFASSQEVFSQTPGDTINSNSNLIFPVSNTTREQADMLQECFNSSQQSWGHENSHPQASHSFPSAESFTEANSESDVPVTANQQPPMNIQDGDVTLNVNPPVTSGNEFFDFCDIFPDSYDFYDGSELNITDLKESNLNDFMHYNQCSGGGQKSSMTPTTTSILMDPSVCQPMNSYLSNVHEPESYMPVGRSDTSDCQSHTIETPSPDFFTLPSASSSSSYSVDSNVLSLADGSSTVNPTFPEPFTYTKCDEIKSPQTCMPVLVRFNNNTPARHHGENDVEVEQAVASIVDLDEGIEEEQSTVKKEGDNPPTSQPPDEMKSDEKLPILSPMNTMATNVSEPVTSIASHNWVENTMTGSTADLDWEIWDSLDLPGCDYADGDVGQGLPILKPNDLLSSLEPYLLEGTGDPDAFDLMDACQQPLSQQQQIVHQPLAQQVLTTEPTLIVPITVSSENQTLCPSLVDSKAMKGEASSFRPRRSVDCLNGSLPLHLWPFDPRLHCGVQRDGTVCRRSLLCKLHSMGLKRQVERPQDIGLLVKQLRESKRLKKLSFSKPETSEAPPAVERRTGSSTFILPNTCASNPSIMTSEASRIKQDQISLVSSGFKYISAPTPIKPAIELVPYGVQQAQALGGLVNSSDANSGTSTNPNTNTTTLLRCAFTGNQIQVSTDLLPTHTGLQVVDARAATGRFGEKLLHIQPPTYTTSGPQSHGLKVISESMQGASLTCDQSIFTQRCSTSTTPYIQLSQAAPNNRAFLQNRQLCAVIGVTQKSSGEFQVAPTPQGPPQPSGGCFSLPQTLHPHQNQQTSNTQAATIIVGDPDCNSGTVQYSNDSKVDSINLLSPNGFPGCISLPPRSARVFQFILPQSATSLSLRPHPGSGGSASVFQLTTTGNSPLGTTTIPLKQAPAMLGTALDQRQQQLGGSVQTSMEVETRIQSPDSDTSRIEYHPAGSHGEMLDQQTVIQSHINQTDGSSLITLAEWEQLQNSGSIVLPSSHGMGLTEVGPAERISDVARTPNSIPNFEQPCLHTEASKPLEDSANWLDFCSSPIKEPIFMESQTTTPNTAPPSLKPQNKVPYEHLADKPKSQPNRHSKLRVLLFDMEDEEEEEDEEEGVQEVRKDGERVLEETDTQQIRSHSEANDEKLKDERLFKKSNTSEGGPNSTSGLPTAIVAPTAFSIAENKSHLMVDALTKEVARKEGPVTPMTAAKRRRQSPIGSCGYQEICLRSPIPLKQKKTEDQTIMISTSCSGDRMTSAAPATLELASTTASTIHASSGAILSLQQSAPSTTQTARVSRLDSITLPASSSAAGGACNGNIIICSSSGASGNASTVQATSVTGVNMASAGGWNYQLKNVESRPASLTLVRFPNGQLAAVPTSVLNGAQLTFAAPQPAPPPTIMPTHQPILESQGGTLVLRYPQQQQASPKSDYQFEPSTATKTATNVADSEGQRFPAAAPSLTIGRNGQLQLQQTSNFQQQQQLVMVSSGAKGACFPTSCDHLSSVCVDSNAGAVSSNGGSVSSMNAAGQLGPQLQTISSAFHQVGAVSSSQLQTPAGAMTVLVRGANSQSSLQFLIPQPDGTMVLQPATMQNQFCSRPTATGVGGGTSSAISLLPPQTSSGYGQTLVHTGYSEGTFQTATTTSGQFVNADDQQTVVAPTSSGFIEFVNAGTQIESMDDGAAVAGGAGSIVSAGDLSKWLRGNSSANVLGSRGSTSQQIFSQRACIDSAGSTVIQLPTHATAATSTAIQHQHHHHQQQQHQSQGHQQLIFLTPNGSATSGANHAFTTVVQQGVGLEPNRALWTTTSTAGATVTSPWQNGPMSTTPRTGSNQ